MILEGQDNNNSRITEYQRLTTYGFDPLDKPSDGCTQDTTYGLLTLGPYGLNLARGRLMIVINFKNNFIIRKKLQANTDPNQGRWFTPAVTLW